MNARTIKIAAAALALALGTALLSVIAPAPVASATPGITCPSGSKVMTNSRTGAQWCATLQCKPGYEQREGSVLCHKIGTGKDSEVPESVTATTTRSAPAYTAPPTTTRSPYTTTDDTEYTVSTDSGTGWGGYIVWALIIAGGVLIWRNRDTLRDRFGGGHQAPDSPPNAYLAGTGYGQPRQPDPDSQWAPEQYAVPYPEPAAPTPPPPNDAWRQQLPTSTEDW